MKNSPFKIALFIINTLSLFLMIVLCWYSGVFEYLLSKLSTNSFLEMISNFFSTVFNNSYFINIFCTIITALFLYFFQVSYSKRHLKKDFRCNEILNGLDDGIEEAKELYQEINSIEGLKTKEHEPDYLKREADNAKKYIEFYQKKSTSVELTKLSLTYHNNQILLDSLQSVFLININFKLLNILNNIKNRIPNVKNNYQPIQDKINRYKKTPSDFSQLELGNLGKEIYFYIQDLNFLANYYLDLFKYLRFDTNEAKELCMYIETNYSNSFFKFPLSEQLKLIKRAKKQIKKKKRKQMWLSFFKD